MVGEPGPPPTSNQLKSLLEALRQQAAQPAHQTSNHGSTTVHTPHNLHNVTHVRIKRHKTHPLQHTYEGPFEIIEHIGKSCIRVRVGSFADGRPRYETHHWQNAKPAMLAPEDKLGERKPLGRKPDILSNTPPIENEVKLDNSRPKRVIRRPDRYNA